MNRIDYYRGCYKSKNNDWRDEYNTPPIALHEKCVAQWERENNANINIDKQLKQSHNETCEQCEEKN